MAIKTLIKMGVNASTGFGKHEPFATGDQVAGNIVQLSADAGNTLVVGADNGLYVAAVAALPDDQVLTGDTSGSVALTLTPTVVGDATNYSIKADVKIDPAAGNIATVTSGGVFVPANVAPTVGTAPTVVDDGTATTAYFGGNSVALGNPLKWESRDGGATVSPVYTASGVSGGITVLTPASQKEFGNQAVTTANLQNIAVTFATPFASAPFITLTSHVQEDFCTWKALNVTTTGFTLEGYGIGPNSFAGNVGWKAENQ